MSRSLGHCGSALVAGLAVLVSACPRTEAPAAAPAEEPAESKDADDDILLKANLSWDINEEAMLYGTVSEGYRRGACRAAGLPFFA